ncbi:threonine synthase [Azotosporobacter soli]|uniref:threonine synthase n=1 Tax=Azotosporobacter soli TaxID=3055040 RepID=UPI0031FED739
MNYISTRGSKERVSSAEAIKRGLAEDGGLFIPEALPEFSLTMLTRWKNMDYRQRAADLLKLFLTDYSEDELKACTAAAYSEEKFSEAAIAPIRSLDRQHHILELWHGPTSAFKDMALQLLPQLLTKALLKTGENSQIAILVATSGDTGKAALEGFRDVEQTKVVVFYPKDGVSEIQRMQMLSQGGSNVAVVAVEGNFDDAQSGVKEIFSDAGVKQRLQAKQIRLSSANSINWGRLAPQIVYYFSAYIDLVAAGQLTLGEKVNFVVPTGNFGNILAGYYAKQMGLPIGRLICAANPNNVLTDFIRTGKYDRSRAFHKTISPSMDILISSNLERMLYYIADGRCELVEGWMKSLKEKGGYDIGAKLLQKVQDIFWSEWVSDELTQETIRKVYEERNYLLDPHTAVAWQAGEAYRKTGDETPQIILSTASPFKFNDSVLKALGVAATETEFAMLKTLAAKTGWTIPTQLAELENLPILHKDICTPKGMQQCVEDILQ